MGASPASTGQEQQDALEVFLSKRGLQCIRVYPSSQSRFDFTMARVLAWDPVRGGQKQIDGFADGLRKTDGSGRTWMNLDGLGRADLDGRTDGPERAELDGRTCWTDLQGCNAKAELDGPERM